jgi:site-specific DNA-methyltransferase (adenine-specific)
MKPYYKNDDAILYNGDSLEILKTIKTDSINLIHIDPPYNIHIAEWDKWETVEKYVEFMGAIFQELDRVLKDNGTMYFWHMDMKQIPHLLLYLEKETNFILNNQIVWDKGDWRALSWLNPTQDNNLRSWFTTTEYCYMFTKQDVDGGRKYKNNIIYVIREYIRNAIMEKDGEISLKKINELLGVATNGGGVASAVLSLDKANPVMITKEHYITLQKEYEELRQEYEELRYTFNLEPLMNNVWKSNIKNDGSNHICEKPLDLIEKIIRVSSNKGDVVLDCFNGSGTTGIVANQLKRKYIGIELMEENCKITKGRLSKL